MKHKTYIINLDHRTDRRSHIFNEFKERSEFEVVLFPAIKDKNGATGLFRSFRSVIELAADNGLPYVIICEDDHAFTSDYEPAVLDKYISLGMDFEFDLLLGGPSKVYDVLFANDDLYWVNQFSGLQFTIVFKRFFQVVLNFHLKEGSALDFELGGLSDNIFALYPSISEQVYFGYSDATDKNQDIDVSTYYKDCVDRIDRLYLINNYYNKLNGGR